MSYPINVNIPASNNTPAQDQPQMLTNFSNISGFLSVDHVAPGTTGDGYHKQTTFNAPISTPAPAGVVSVLYSKTTGSPSAQQLFFKNVQASEQQITGLPRSLGVTGSKGYYTLQGGLIFQWGRLTTTGSTTEDSFPIAFTTALLSFQITAVEDTQNGFAWQGPGIGTQLTNFAIVKSGSTFPQVWWFAIGY